MPQTLDHNFHRHIAAIIPCHSLRASKMNVRQQEKGPIYFWKPAQRIPIPGKSTPYSLPDRLFGQRGLKGQTLEFVGEVCHSNKPKFFKRFQRFESLVRLAGNHRRLAEDKSASRQAHRSGRRGPAHTRVSRRIEPVTAVGRCPRKPFEASCDFSPYFV